MPVGGYPNQFSNALNGRTAIPSGAFRRCGQDEPIPQSEPPKFNQTETLGVPHQFDIPMGQEHRFFDRGTFTGSLRNSPGNWGDGKIHWIQNGTENYAQNWNDRQDIADFAKYVGSYQNSDGNSPLKTEYDVYSDKMNAEISANISQEQKELLNALENGLITKNSRLQEVDIYGK